MTRPGRSAAGLLLGLALASGAAGAESPRPLGERLAEYQGRVVVLNFWAAWCGPCKNEMPRLARLSERFASQDVVFLGASTDAEQERDKAEELLEKTGVRYPIWYGLSDADMRPLGLGSAIPVTAIFDRDGTRAFRLIGEVQEKWIAERIEWLLGPREKKPPDELRIPPGLSRKEYEDPAPRD